MQGYIVVDAQNGCELCERCGVLTSEGLNMEPEYVAPPDGPVRRWTSSSTASIPKWVKYMIEPSASKKVSYYDDLEHWNHYAKLTPDEVSSVASLLQKCDFGARYGREVRVAAGLLHKRLSEHFPDEDAVRRNLKRGLGLEEVRPSPPIPQFACPQCGRMHHDMRSARYHCRTPYGMKKKSSLRL
jgi:hypothetical protein